jgi:RimJ/RimL family protein N-acetyltransferase
MSHDTNDPSGADAVVLRDVVDDDLPLFFEQQLDPEANQMAAFTTRDPTDRAAFIAHWARVRTDDTITLQTILNGGAVMGNIVCYSDFGAPEVGYWVGKAFWGRGIATRALTAFLRQIETRPLYAHVAKDNLASLRVLQNAASSSPAKTKNTPMRADMRSRTIF